MKIAVLAVQGAFIEHERKLEVLGASCVELRKAEDLNQSYDGLVLPGGESTVQGKLLRELGMFDTIRKQIKEGLPVLATCAGMILLADSLEGDAMVHLQTVPMTVKRNAYGRQLGSFHTEAEFKGIGEIPMTFIRAPYVADVSDGVEVLAAGMILMTGWKGECDLIDPMCGSGTIPIEAALIARNIAPGVFRKEFAFEKWNDFDQELFDRIYNDDSQEREFTHKIFGYDNNPKANEIATHNVKAAGLSKEIILKIQPFQQFEQPKEKSIIITNPPYGERISTNDLLGLYQMIGERLKHSFTGNDAWVLSYREECFDQIGLKPSIKIPLFNGSLECEFRKYQLFNGKFKEFRSENADQEFKPRREEIRPRRNTEKVEYGERRERRSFDNRREGHGEYKGGERRERRSFDDKREGRGDFKRGEHRNFGDRREGRDNFKSSPRKFDDNKEKTEE